MNEDNSPKKSKWCRFTWSITPEVTGKTVFVVK